MSPYPRMLRRGGKHTHPSYHRSIRGEYTYIYSHHTTISVFAVTSLLEEGAGGCRRAIVHCMRPCAIIIQ